MKVALFTDTYLPDINGVVTSVELLRSKLEEKGHTVYVVCTHSSPLGIKREGNIIRLPGIEIKKLYGYSIASPAHFLLIDELRSFDFDIIHVHTEFGVGIFAEICARRLNVPLVRTYHTTYEDYTHYVNPLNFKSVEKVAKKFVTSFTKMYGKSCLRMIAPSRKTADMLLRYGIDTPIEIIPTGIDLKSFYRPSNSKSQALELRRSLGLSADDLVFLYVGRLAEEKSIDMIIEAFSLIDADYYKLVIVGGGPQEEDLHDLANDDNRIVFTGKVPFAQVSSYYHMADAFISASTSETQGMTYIEALASSLPVFARNDDVVRDIVVPDENGYIFDDAQMLSDELIAFGELSLSQRAKLSENAVNSIGQYDSDIFVDRVNKLYDEAIVAFGDCYSIKKTKLKDDSVVLTISRRSVDEKITLSLDDYVNLGLRNNSLIQEYDYEKLKLSENRIKAYQSCLRKLANRDYSIFNMRVYLMQHFMLSDQELDDIINKLISLNLLNDQKYAISKINSFENVMYSQKKIRNKLLKDGVDRHIIEDVINKNADLELMKARKLAEKYVSSIRNKSMNMKKQMIYHKLISEGFSNDVVNETMSHLDLGTNLSDEKDLLKKEAYKLKKKYEKKYQNTELRNRIFMGLERRGFSLESIYAIINELED